MPPYAEISLSIAALTWWDETMSTRLNNPKTGSKIIVMQRIHEKDLSGHVLQQGGYVHLNLPAEFELSRRCVTVIGIDGKRHFLRSAVHTSAQDAGHL